MKGLSLKRRFGLLRVLVIAAGCGLRTVDGLGQAPIDAAVPAGKRLEFDLASVRENRSDEKPSSNFPLNPGPQFAPVAGHLIGRNMLLLQYIVFAYKPSTYQIQVLREGLPPWTRSAHYNIEARVEGNPSKDEMRVMMQSLLASRFGMAVHHESRTMAVFAMVLVKPGKLGPKLRVHPADDPGCTRTPLPVAYGDGYPAACGVGTMVAPSEAGWTAIGGQNVPIPMMAMSLPYLFNNVERPVIDQTGLAGGFDYTLEWAPETAEALSSQAAGPDASDVFGGPTFQGALKDQLGLKLTSRREAMDVIVVDRIEPPSEN